MDSPKFPCIELCAGLSGIVLGVKRVLPGVGVVAYAEIEEYICGLLASRMEEGVFDVAPIWTDLRTFPWHYFRGRVCGIFAGFPCPPFSSAGKRKSTEDPRHLWPHIETAIRVIRPGFVFLENVEGILSAKCRNAFGASDGTPVLLYVAQRLEIMGYRVAVAMVSASESGAPHQRKRIFIGALRRDVADCNGQREQQSGGVVGESRRRARDGGEGMADSTVAGLQERLRAAIDDYREQQAAERGGTLWPSGPGEPQFLWEPPRVLLPHPRRSGRKARGKLRKGKSDPVGGSEVEHAGGVAGERRGEPGVVRGEASAQSAEGLQRERTGHAAGRAGSDSNVADTSGGRRSGQGEGEVQLTGGTQAERAGPVMADADGAGRAPGGDDRGMGRFEEPSAQTELVDPSIWNSGGRSEGAGRRLEQPENASGGAGDAPWIPALKSAMGRVPDGVQPWARLAELSGLSLQELEEISEWLCRTDNRTDELRGFGNAVVPDSAERGFFLTMSSLLGLNT